MAERSKTFQKPYLIERLHVQISYVPCFQKILTLIKYHDKLETCQSPLFKPFSNNDFANSIDKRIFYLKRKKLILKLLIRLYLSSTFSNMYYFCFVFSIYIYFSHFYTTMTFFSCLLMFYFEILY